MIPANIIDNIYKKNKTFVCEELSSINANKKRPLGKFSPWAWCLEPVRGCNLRCWHCPVRLFDGKLRYMSKDTWINIWKIIKEVSPYCRVEMANSGEATLHPYILEFISIARNISPNSQIQITTNGLTLIKNKITYKQLFDAGLNVIYVDMYSPKEQHINLARKSGYPFYEYYKKDKDKKTISAWTYHNDPDIKFIALAEIPDNWPKQKISRGGLGTFLNTIDFKSSKAKELGVKPVIIAPKRRCNQPMKYIQVTYDGTYLFCCQDVFNRFHIKNNVNNGIDDFFKFWFGKKMQYTRKVLRNRDRDKHIICKKCSIMFSRCDMLFWKEKMFNVVY